MSAILTLDNKEFLTKLEATNKSLGRISKQAGQLGQSLTRNLSLPLAAISGLAVKTFVGFEKQMATVAAVSGATGAELKALTEQAKELGASTVFSASEVGQLQESLARLGLTSGEIQQATSSILALAQATGTDLASAADIVGSALRQMGLDADEAGRVSDVFALSTARSALSMDSLKEAMAEFGPIAASVGLSLEQTTGLLAVLANNGIRGSKAGTSLKAIFSELNAKGMDVATVLQQVQNGTIGFVEAVELVGKRGAPGLLALGKAGNDEIGRLISLFDNAGGAAEGMAAILDDTAYGTMKGLQSAAEGAAIALGESMTESIKGLTDFVTKLARSFASLDKSTIDNIARIIRITALVGPLLVIFSKLTKGLQAMTVAYQKNLAALIKEEAVKKAANVTTGQAAVATASDTAAKTANAAASNLAASATLKFRAATVALKSALIQTGIGAIVVALGYMIDKLLFANTTMSETERIMGRWDKALDKVTQNVAATKERLQSYVDTLKEAEEGSTAYETALAMLNEESEEYFGHLSNSEDAALEAQKALDGYTEAIKRNALAQAASATQQRLYEQKLSAESIQAGVDALTLTGPTEDGVDVDRRAVLDAILAQLPDGAEITQGALKGLKYSEVADNIAKGVGMMRFNEVGMPVFISAEDLFYRFNEDLQMGVDRSLSALEVESARIDKWLQENQVTPFSTGGGAGGSGDDTVGRTVSEIIDEWDHYFATQKKMFEDGHLTEKEYFTSLASMRKRLGQELYDMGAEGTGDRFLRDARDLEEQAALYTQAGDKVSNFAERSKAKLNELDGQLASNSISQAEYNAQLAEFYTEEAKMAEAIGEHTLAKQLNAKAYELATDAVANQTKSLEMLREAAVITEREYLQGLLNIQKGLYDAAIAAGEFGYATQRLANIKELQGQIDALDTMSQKYQAMSGIAQNFASAFGQAVGDAMDGTESFLESLKNGFKAAFKQLLTQVITLIALFAILNILTGGSFAAKGGAGGGSINLGQFISQGMGFPTASAKSTMGGGAGGGNTNKSLNVTGTIDNGVIALSNSQGTVRNQRMYGG